MSVLLLSAVLAGTLPGCGYGELSPLGYDYSMALYAICNRRDADKLGELREKVEASQQQQEISDQESQWLTDIIGQAESGQWQTAVEETRRLMEDQVQGR